MSNLSRHIRQVHNNETIECSFCTKSMSTANINKHIKTIHKRLKKSCDICNEDLPYAAMSVHRRKEHNIGKPMSEISPRGPNFKLRRRNTLLKTESIVKKNVEMEEYYVKVEKSSFEEVQVGDKNFTFS